MTPVSLLASEPKRFEDRSKLNYQPPSASSSQTHSEEDIDMRPSRFYGASIPM